MMADPRRGEEYVRWLHETGADESDAAYARAIQDLRNGSRSWPFGSLRGRNRQNKRRAAIRQSEKDE